MKEAVEFLFGADDSDIGIAIVAPDLSIVFTNEKANSLYTLAKGDPFPADTKAGQMLQFCLRNEKRVAGFPIQEMVNGASVQLLLYVYPLQKNESVSSCLILLCDHSLFGQQYESKIRQERVDLIGDMAAGTANVILNPLAIIKGTLQLMEKSIKSEITAAAPFFQYKNAQYFQTLYDQVTEINAILHRFLLFKPSDLKFTPIAWTPFLQDVVSRIQLKALEKNIGLVCEFPNRSARVFGNEFYLREACYALFLNAFEATEANGKIVIRTEVRDDAVLFTVIDYGQGIPQEVLPNVKYPFFTTKPESLGFGLSFSDHVMQMMGGKLDIQSSPGETKVQLMLTVMDVQEFDIEMQ
ncbi:hypothetical protein BG53_12635 [Paenibacillus darwinianus]|uniref:histidine kinase n=1 Tax=Paenibacillus darwinianus TaxID=1380763 RepID=A0A9W5W854_9BACL|nr:ATP-binding protein [Paenibacillus darwinianus]EXX90199.1 hypothetical protein BG52_13775 [Paenibacillus darwinianus]EXX90880.1 hypothetical protein BG53_12635 [Paenibacillus darwinianus]EXX90918.1 hypothetical protein CH50_14595 [Paenibacillus darwinianus]